MIKKLDETKPILKLQDINITKEEIREIGLRLITKHKAMLDYLKDK